MNRTNIALAVLLVVTVLLTFATRVDYSQPNFEILPDMKYSPAPTAYTPSSVFPNGRTLQDPVAGTIARRHMPIHYAATKEDAIRAGEELPNPLDASGSEDEPKRLEKLQKSIGRGAKTYRVYCACCHGAGGEGDGLVAVDPRFPRPPSFLTEKSRQIKDGQLFHILTYGQGNMAEFAGQLSPEQRWDAINFVRSVHPRMPVELGLVEPGSVGGDKSSDVAPGEEPKTPPNDAATAAPQE